MPVIKQMLLTEQDIRRIAKLAHIAISDEQLPACQTDMNLIMKHIHTLQTADTTGVVPMSHAQDMQLSTRPDVVTEHNQREALQAAAPQTEQGLYLVPKVI